MTKKVFRPSELDTFATCARKWGYLYLDKLERPPTKALELGTAVHKVLEKFIKNKIFDSTNDAALIAEPGLVFIPKNIPTENVERKIKFTHKNIGFSGTPDFFKHEGNNIWLLGDHKTCSTLSSALSKESLKTNIQATTYAQWLFQELGAETVKLRWIYYRTKGKPKATCIEAEIKKEEQPKLFWPQTQIASSIMSALESKVDSLELPKNYNACFKYGPCPFLEACKLNQKPVAMRSLPLSNEPVKIPFNNDSFHLFVDCVPTKVESSYKKTLELSELIEPVLKKIKQEKNISHYRLMGYGQHVGVISFYLEEFLKEKALKNDTAVLSTTKTPEGVDTLQTLSAAASRVIRGF